MSYICEFWYKYEADNRNLFGSFKMERQREIDLGERCEYTATDKSHKKCWIQVVTNNKEWNRQIRYQILCQVFLTDLVKRRLFPNGILCIDSTIIETVYISENSVWIDPIYIFPNVILQQHLEIDP